MDSEDVSEHKNNHSGQQKLEKLSPEKWFEARKWKENPFTFNIYPYLFVGYQEQINHLLLMLLEKHKFVFVSGPTGSGKTTLLKWVEKMSGKVYDILYIGKPPSKSEDFALIFNEKFKIKWPMSMFKKGLKNIYQVPDFLNKKLKKRHLVIMIDEVHEASVETLEWLRVLGDQVTNISFVLAGLPVFDDKLMDKLETFRKRIVAKIDLASLTKEETEEMIRKRIKHVGGAGDEFSKELLDFIHARSGGFPREILRVCDELVTNAILRGETEIKKDSIENIEPQREERVSLEILDTFTPMQRDIVETLSQRALSPGQIADSLSLDKYKSRQHAVRSVNNILKMLLADGYVERQQSEKTFVYSLTPKIKSLLVRA